MKPTVAQAAVCIESAFDAAAAVTTTGEQQGTGAESAQATMVPRCLPLTSARAGRGHAPDNRTARVDVVSAAAANAHSTVHVAGGYPAVYARAAPESESGAKAGAPSGRAPKRLMVLSSTGTLGPLGQR